MAFALSLHVAALSCSVVAVLIYLNTLNCKLVFDDVPAIIENKDMKPSSPWSNLLLHDFWGDQISHPRSHKSFRPLTSATFKAHYHWHGERALGYHLVNILLNSFVCYLFVIICCYVLFEQVWPSFIAGIFYTVHPIHTEAVAGIVGRAEILSAIFFLLTLLVYKEALNRNKQIGLNWLLPTILLCLCSMLSKEQGITAFGVCLMYELFITLKIDFHGAVDMFNTLVYNPRRLPKEHKAFFIRLIVFSVILVVVLTARVELMQGGPTFTRINNPGPYLNTPLRQLYYLYLCFLNVWLFLNPSQLRHDYRQNYIPVFESSTDPRSILTLLTFMGLCVLGLGSVLGKGRSLRSASFALMFALLTFLPATNLFFSVGFIVAERVLYLPSMGASLLIAIGAWRMIQSSEGTGCRRVLVKCSILYLVLVHSVKTIHRGGIWHSGHDLYIDALKTYSNDGLMFSNLGHSFFTDFDDLLRAEKCHIMATKLSPNFSQPFRNYGSMLHMLERHDEAEREYYKAVKILGYGPRSKRSMRLETYGNLAAVIGRNDSRLSEAISLLDKVIELEQPEELAPYKVKADFLVRSNRSQEALRLYRELVRWHPDKSTVFELAGDNCLAVGDRVCAEEYYHVGMTNRNGYLMLKYYAVMAEKPDITAEEIKMTYNTLYQIVKTKPNLTEAHYSLGMLYSRLNKTSKAMESFQSAHSLDPTHLNTIKGMARIHYTHKRYSKVVQLLGAMSEEKLKRPENAALVNFLGTSYWNLGEMQKAEEFVRRMLECDSEHTTAMKVLGSFKIEQKNYTQAEKLFQKVQELDSTDEYASRSLKMIRNIIQQT